MPRLHDFGQPWMLALDLIARGAAAADHGDRRRARALLQFAEQGLDRAERTEIVHEINVRLRRRAGQHVPHPELRARERVTGDDPGPLLHSRSGELEPEKTRFGPVRVEHECETTVSGTDIEKCGISGRSS